tara:strand:- start:1478 stop:1843 length:366 start_codon:yes stop_codon:yes gene_type:complete
MASLSVNLGISSSDVTTDSLNVGVADVLAVTDPAINIARMSVPTGSAATVVASNSAFSYVYLKVVSGVNPSDWVQVLLGGNAKFKIRVGEFAFFPLYNAQAITAEAQGGACVVEYGAWSIA